jgi:hypothetical protein
MAKVEFKSRGSGLAPHTTASHFALTKVTFDYDVNH